GASLRRHAHLDRFAALAGLRAADGEPGERSRAVATQDHRLGAAGSLRVADDKAAGLLIAKIAAREVDLIADFLRAFSTCVPGRFDDGEPRCLVGPLREVLEQLDELVEAAGFDLQR